MENSLNFAPGKNSGLHLSVRIALRSSIRCKHISSKFVKELYSSLSFRPPLQYLYSFTLMEEKMLQNQFMTDQHSPRNVVPTLTDIAVIRAAIEICNDLELKKEILLVPGSELEIFNQKDSYKKLEWNEIIEKKATVLLENVGVPKQLQEKVKSIVLPVGMRMLTWAKYHEINLGISCEYTVNFLNSSYFTKQGIIDSKKAAEEMMKDESLNVKQKYKLACLYCFTNHISVLHKEMPKEEFYDAERPQRIKQPELIKFWSYYQMDDIDKLKGEKSLDRYALETLVESGSKTAAEFYLEKTNSSRKKHAVVEAAVEAVKCRVREGTLSDWVIFQNKKCKSKEPSVPSDYYVDIRYPPNERSKSKESWVPSDYYVDILCFLLLKMEEDQQIEFLKKDIEGAEYERESAGDHSRVLKYLLNWPYQDQFMKTAGRMWEFLPEMDYAVLLLKICEHIEPKELSSDEMYLKYDDLKSYDYKKLLKEFWCQSPERYKRYVFNNQTVCYIGLEGWVTAKTGLKLLYVLLTLKNFTYEDGKIIRLILANATDNEKEQIIYSQECKKFCIKHIKEGKWEMLCRFARNCFLSKEEDDKFRRKLSFTEEAKRICIDFIKCNKRNAAESFIKWSSLPEEEIKQLKKEMIFSEDGKRICCDLILHEEKGVEVANKFSEWYFSSTEDVIEFKKELIFSDSGVECCATLIKKDKIKLADEFVSWCLSSQEEIKELKKNVGDRKGCFVCEYLISNYLEFDVFDGDLQCKGTKLVFDGGKWEEVENFLTWCFSSEKEINEFKKEKLLEISGKEIHFNLVKSNQWKVAETFFAWLGLSDEEVKELKKETLYHHDAASTMFSQLMFSKVNDKIFLSYGSNQEAIELLLRWYLTDKETVLDFKEEFKRQYCGEVTEERKAVFENFDFMIEKRLKDLNEEIGEVKRKTEAFSQNKKLCNV